MWTYEGLAGAELCGNGRVLDLVQEAEGSGRREGGLRVPKVRRVTDSRNSSYAELRSLSPSLRPSLLASFRSYYTPSNLCTMPTISVDKAELYKRLEKTYSQSPSLSSGRTLKHTPSDSLRLCFCPVSSPDRV